MSCSSTQHGAPNEDRVPLPSLQEAEVKNKIRGSLEKTASCSQDNPSWHVNKELLDSLYRPLQCF